MNDSQDTEERSVADIANREAGIDDNPYEHRSITDLPPWWQDAIREYDAYGVRAFRPSRFQDGILVETLLARLESEYDVSVSLYGNGVEYGDPWTLSVDGRDIADVGHRRSPDGYSVFETTSDRVVDLVATHAGSSE